jgi:hypothetical protein
MSVELLVCYMLWSIVADVGIEMGGGLCIFVV